MLYLVNRGVGLVYLCRSLLLQIDLEGLKSVFVDLTYGKETRLMCMLVGIVEDCLLGKGYRW